MKYALFLLVVFTSSCGFNHWSKRGVQKGWYKNDTIIDSVFTKESSKDTIFNNYYTRDTVILKENKLTVKYFYNNSDSTVYLSGKCESDTIIVEKVINTVKGVHAPNWIYFVVATALFLLIVLLKR